ncbi:MAG: hypothetical protein U1F16_13680 [Turneriella sp.]
MKPSVRTDRLRALRWVVILVAIVALGCISGPAKSERLGLGVAAIAADSNATCAVFTNGKAACVGRTLNITGQFAALAVSPAASGADYLKLDFPLSMLAIHRGSGGMHACALTTAAQVYCWGDNKAGQAGPAAEESVLSRLADAQKIPLKRLQQLRPLESPALIALPAAASGIVTGYAHSCALLINGEVYCWGNNTFGQLGLGSRKVEQSVTPLKVDLLSDDEVRRSMRAKQIAAGNNHSCALLTDGSVRCWGHNDFAQLGYVAQARNDGDHDRALLVIETPADKGNVPIVTPAELAAGTRAIAVAAGGDRSCAILSNGRVRCWGENRWQKLGYPAEKFEKISTLKSPAELGDIPLTGSAAMLAMSEIHTCALMTSGDLFCWGSNETGQLGNPAIRTTENADAWPLTAVAWRNSGETARITGIALGSGHSCALLTSGKMRCWGLAFDGQAGTGSGNRYGKAGCMNGQPYCIGDEADEWPVKDVEW